MLNTALLDILSCPCCYSSLKLGDNKLICNNKICRTEYPIIEGIPIMLPPELIDYKHFKQQQNYFNKEFEQYESYRLENWRLCYLSKIFSDLEFSNNDSYLDIGVGGSGYTIIEAAKRGHYSVGVDISFEGLLKAKSFAKTQLNEKIDLCDFVLCHGEKLPFKNTSFTKMSLVSVLEHFVNDDIAINEISRVLKTKGKVWVNVPNAFRYINPLFWFPYYIHDKKIGHLRHYDSKELNGKFSKYGLKCTNVKYSGHFLKVIQSILTIFFKEMNFSRSGIWWKIESHDKNLEKNVYGLNLTMVFKKS